MAVKPKISVVLTTYQRPKMLKRAIKSILRQSFKDFELIIVDDASADEETQQVIEKYKNKDDRIRSIRLPKNFGSHTRPKNLGTIEAQADLIAYFDDDNEMLRDHLQTLYKYQERSGADVTYGMSEVINEMQSSMPTVSISADINNPNHSIFDRNFIDTNQVLIKKSVIEKIGGWDETMPRFADWNLFARLKKIEARFTFVPIIITRYYMHKGSNQLAHKDFNFDPLTCPIWPQKTLYGTRKPLKVAVFTLTKDRLYYTKDSFKSLRATTKYPFDHYVVDNGSTDGTVKWLKENEGDFKQVIYNKENVGISKGSNQALDAMGDEYDIIIKFDNDCEVIDPNWLEMFVEFYNRFPRAVLSPAVEGLRDNPGGAPRKFGFMQFESFMIGRTDHVGGIFCVAPADLYKGFRWQSNDFLHSNQDSDFSRYASEHRHLIGYLENLRVAHMDTTEGQEARDPEYHKKRVKEKQTRYAKSN